MSGRKVGSVSVQTFLNCVDRHVDEGLTLEDSYSEVRSIFESDDATAIETEVALAKTWAKDQERDSNPPGTKGRKVSPEVLAIVHADFPAALVAQFDAGTLEKKTRNMMLNSARAKAKLCAAAE